MQSYVRENLARLMASQGLSIDELSARSRLDKRTVQGILNGTHRPHAQTLHRLARGLQVQADELFLDPSRLIYRCFDRQTNPAVQEAIDSHPDLFADWSQSDFEELHSRMGTGGALNVDGAVNAAKRLNRKRELSEELAVLMESMHADLVANILDILYRQVTAQSTQ